MTGAYDIVKYYADLLIIQYVGKSRAYQTIRTVVTPILMPTVSVQEIAFNAVPDAGLFRLSWRNGTVLFPYTSSTAAIQASLRTIDGLELVTVSGSIAEQKLIVTFTGVPAPADPLILTINTLSVGGVSITVVITGVDLTLPLKVQDGFNLLGDSPAVGAQLDTLGKYAGVTRTGAGFSAQITLGDGDFLRLIQMAIIKNNSGSSLSVIQDLLFQFFPGEVFVFDNQNMQLSYLIQSSIGSQDLVQLFVTEGLLPKPMGVQLAAVIYAPVINTFFGFRTYEAPAVNASPFNTYDDYQLDRPWLSYLNAIF